MIMIIKIILIIGLTILLLIIFGLIYKLYKNQIDELEYRILILERRCNDNKKHIKTYNEYQINYIQELIKRIEKLERKIKMIKEVISKCIII